MKATSLADAAILGMTPADIGRFWSKVSTEPGQGPAGECWEWVGGRDGRGYGRFGIRRDGRDRPVFASRVAFFLANGVLPSPHALHHCDNPPCCRGEHIFEGDQQDNMRDRDLKGRLVRGENRAQAKLSDALASEMRGLHSGTGASYSALGRRFGVHRETARKCIQRLTWGHVP